MIQKMKDFKHTKTQIFNVVWLSEKENYKTHYKAKFVDFAFDSFLFSKINNLNSSYLFQSEIDSIEDISILKDFIIKVLGDVNSESFDITKLENISKELPNIQTKISRHDFYTFNLNYCFSNKTLKLSFEIDNHLTENYKENMKLIIENTFEEETTEILGMNDIFDFLGVISELLEISKLVAKEKEIKKYVEPIN
jgi:hypothetical protein